MVVGDSLVGLAAGNRLTGSGWVTGTPTRNAFSLTEIVKVEEPGEGRGLMSVFLVGVVVFAMSSIAAMKW